MTSIFSILLLYGFSYIETMAEENFEENNNNSLPNEIKDWGFQTFNIGIFDLDKLLDTPLFYIRYRGSGRYSDDWKNRNVNIKIVFTRG